MNSYIITLSSAFVVDRNKLYDFEVKIGASDSSGHGLFLGNKNSKAVLIKIRESDHSVVLSKSYGNTNQQSYYVNALNLYTTSSALGILVATNVDPSWTVQAGQDNFLAIRLALDGSSVMLAFGFGSNSGIGEQSYGIQIA